MLYVWSSFSSFVAGCVRSEVAQRERPSERLVQEVEQICGAGSVELR